jgi:hypothetical protein
MENTAVYLVKNLFWVQSHAFCWFEKFKVMLKAKIVPILFSQIHQKYAKYTFETFTVDGIDT